MTELGASTALTSVDIDAPNWMAALTEGRAKIGETGGVPAGASCAVAPDGRVTILDPVAHRSYVLTPEGGGTLLSSMPPPAAPSKPPASGTSVRPRASERPASSQAPIPYGSTPLGGRNASEIAVAGTQTLAGAQAARAVSIPAPSSSPGSNSSPGSASSPGSTSSPGTSSSPGNTSSPGSTSSPGTAPAEAAHDEPILLSQLAKVAGADAALNVGAPFEPDESAVPTRVQTKPPVIDDADASGEWVLIDSRDEEASTDSPITYRERTYVVDRTWSSDRVAAHLRGCLAELDADLAAVPRGKFVVLAAFDHRWESAPERPPVAVLEWKDWRGEPVVQFPLAEVYGTRVAEPAVAPEPTAPNQLEPSAAEPDQVGSGQAAPTQAEEAPGAPAPSAAPQAVEAAVPAATPVPPRARDSEPFLLTKPSSRPPPAGPNTSVGDDTRLVQAFEAIQDIHFLSTPAEGFDFVVRVLDELVPCEAATGAVYDIDTDELRFVALRGVETDECRGNAVPASLGLFGATITRNAAVVVPDLMEDTRFDDEAEGRPGLMPRDAVYVPVERSGRLFGVLQLLNRRGRGPNREGLGAFSETDVEIANYLARQLAEFLAHARLSLEPARR
ncbi:MAG: GAF domain-containing protein [Polyangiales bacterium]